MTPPSRIPVDLDLGHGGIIGATAARTMADQHYLAEQGYLPYLVDVPAETLETQLRRGVLEYCVLGLLEERPHYGHELVRRLSRADGLLTSEGTIYPLLARMRREEQVVTEWQESAAGPPRRYYRLTDGGRRALADFRQSWKRFRNAVESVISLEGER